MKSSRWLPHASCAGSYPRSSSRLPNAVILRRAHSRAGSCALFFQLTPRAQRRPGHPIASRAHLQTQAAVPSSTWDPQKWELTVGVEVHAQLQAERKLFSPASTSVNAQPNTHVSVFDAGLPGTQPTLQAAAVIPALRAALAFDCDIQRLSRFDRKHYFYHDQPIGYQLTQYYEPFARKGTVVLYPYDGIAAEDGERAAVGLGRIQLEQDTGKSTLQSDNVYLLDFNRVSHPLIEIVSLPQMHHPATAAAFVRKVQWTLKSVGACMLGMELGGLRADVNVSVRWRAVHGISPDARRPGHPEALGRRTEIKNLSSFKAVEEAIEAERDRQVAILEAGGVVEGETRGWTLGGRETVKLRDKEGVVDYRYLPDPDLPPLRISKELIDHVRSTLPMLPDEQMQLLTTNSTFNLSAKDARTLIVLDDGDRLDYYQTVYSMVEDRLREEVDSHRLPTSKIGRTLGNWVLHELGGLLSAKEMQWSHNPVAETTLADIVVLLLKGEITGNTAKSLLSMAFKGERRPIAEIVKEQSLLLRPMSQEEYDSLAAAVVAEHAAIAEQVRATGKLGKLNFLVGQLIRRGEKGRVEARKAEAALRRLLGLQ